jgi:hypothetical protein
LTVRLMAAHINYEPLTPHEFSFPTTAIQWPPESWLRPTHANCTSPKQSHISEQERYKAACCDHHIRLRRVIEVIQLKNEMASGLCTALLCRKVPTSSMPWVLPQNV